LNEQLKEMGESIMKKIDGRSLLLIVGFLCLLVWFMTREQLPDEPMAWDDPPADDSPANDSPANDSPADEIEVDDHGNPVKKGE